MTKWARIENNVAVELTTIDPNGRFHPSLVWEIVPDDVTELSTFEVDEKGDKVWNVVYHPPLPPAPEPEPAPVDSTATTEPTPAP